MLSVSSWSSGRPELVKPTVEACEIRVRVGGGRQIIKRKLAEELIGHIEFQIIGWKTEKKHSTTNLEHLEPRFEVV